MRVQRATQDLVLWTLFLALSVMAQTPTISGPEEVKRTAMVSPVVQRQDPTTVLLDPTATEQSSQPSMDIPILTRKLEPAPTPIPLADRMGLIMPDPYNKVYTGELPCFLTSVYFCQSIF